MLGIASRLGLAPLLTKAYWRIAGLFGILPPPRLVRIAPGAAGHVCFDRLRDACQSADLPIFYSGSKNHRQPQINVREQDMLRFYDLLLDVLAKDDVYVRRNNRTVAISALQESRSNQTVGSDPRRQARSYEILVTEAKALDRTPASKFVSKIFVNVWTPVVLYSEEDLYSCGRSLPYCSRIRKETLDRLASENVDLDADPAQDIYQPDFEVDVVYTWVNDSDPEWRAQKEFYLPATEQTNGSVSRAGHSERFRNRDELRYSLRSIELFVPWVRNIYIVTADQKPEWLNLEHPKIRLVSHRDIFKNPSDLPTFNSSAIETQLHHIDGLAPHFIYFNDDVFMGRPCSANTFFLPNGILKFFPSSQRVYEYDTDVSREEYLVADRNAIELFKRDFGRFGRLLMLHVPHPSGRELLFELEQRYARAFDECTTQRFRSARDLRPISFMQQHYGFFRHKAVPASISHRYLALWKPTIEAQLQGVARTRRYKTFCINDVGLTEERQSAVDQAVAEFLTSYFPLKSSFEI
jgi:hypothetical protein